MARLDHGVSRFFRSLTAPRASSSPSHFSDLPPTLFFITTQALQETKGHVHMKYGMVSVRNNHPLPWKFSFSIVT